MPFCLFVCLNLAHGKEVGYFWVFVLSGCALFFPPPPETVLGSDVVSVCGYAVFLRHHHERPVLAARLGVVKEPATAEGRPEPLVKRRDERFGSPLHTVTRKRHLPVGQAQRRDTNCRQLQT